MNDNKNTVIKLLKELESKDKKKEILWLTESGICETLISNPLRKANKTVRPILIPYENEETKAHLRKDDSGKDRYYSTPVILFGNPYLVFNHWTKTNMNSFQDWVKKVLGENLE